jgi:hypothetical protein
MNAPFLLTPQATSSRNVATNETAPIFLLEANLALSLVTFLQIS